MAILLHVYKNWQRKLSILQNTIKVLLARTNQVLIGLRKKVISCQSIWPKSHPESPELFTREELKYYLLKLNSVRK